MTYIATTQLLQVEPRAPESESIQVAADVIQRGGLVAFPTETVYGLGANGLEASAVQKIFSAKGRPASDPIILHVANAEQLAQVAIDIPAIAHQLTQRFWPGPLTLVLKRHAQVPDVVTANLDTVAVRMPNHPVARALIEASGVPIAAPSANKFARPSPTTAQHVLEDLDGSVDIVLDGGATTIGLESTVLDLTQKTPTILRPGGVPIEDIREVLPDITIRREFISVPEDDLILVSPGMLLKHYSPRAEVRLFVGSGGPVIAHMQKTILILRSSEKRVGVMVCDEDYEAFSSLPVHVTKLGPCEDMMAIGRRLFAAMRELDAEKVDVIMVKGIAQQGLGLAIWDRLIRAAEGQMIRVYDDGTIDSA